MNGRLCRLRPYRTDDAPALRHQADDFLVARWMTQRFPHPYTLRDAEEWIAYSGTNPRAKNYVIEVDGKLAGGIGFECFEVERDGVAIFGYWLGRSYWGRGVASEAASMLADNALTTEGLRRLEASVFEANAASIRVLEKCGFVREGRLRSLYLDRDGAVCDAFLYAKLKEG
jgi:[ribosomal protein S5]-alanine N-acetyltransferase